MKERVYYQWLPGTENEGTVSILSNIFVEDGEKYYEFTDGNLCYEGLICDFTTDPNKIKGKALVRVISPKDLWTFETIKSKSMESFAGVSSESGATNIEIPSLFDYNSNSSNKSAKVKYIPPKNQLLSSFYNIDYKDWMSDNDLKLLGIIEDNCISDIVHECHDNYQADNNMPYCNDNCQVDLSGEINISDNNSISVVNIKTDKSYITEVKYPNTTLLTNDINNQSDKNFDDNDPVAILVNKAAKFESTISMDLNIELPAKSLFKIASENFENGEETFLNVILSHIDNEKIKQSLKDALKNAYNEE